MMNPAQIAAPNKLIPGLEVRAWQSKSAMVQPASQYVAEMKAVVVVPDGYRCLKAARIDAVYIGQWCGLMILILPVGATNNQSVMWFTLNVRFAFLILQTPW